MPTMLSSFKNLQKSHADERLAMLQELQDLKRPISEYT